MNAAIEGRITHVNGNVIQGWAFNPRAPQTRWIVAIYSHDQLLGLAQANAFHAQAPGDGQHGFSLLLDDAQLDAAHTLELCIANHPDNTLDQLTLPSHNIDTGHGDTSAHVTWQPGLLLSGWLVESSAPHQPLDVTVYARGNPIAKATPTRWINHQGTQVQAGFQLSLPFWLANGECHTLQVIDSRGRELTGSPLTVQEYSSGLNAWLNTLVPTLPSATQTLITQQLKRYERWLPRAVGLDEYPQWLKAFAADIDTKAPTQAEKNMPTLGILWLGHAPKSVLETLSKLPGITLTHAVASSTAQQHSDTYQAILAELTATCSVVTQLHGDDRLDPAALQQAWHTLATTPHAQLVYTDFDMPGATPEAPRLPALLPAYDPERQWAQDYIGGGVCLVRSALLQQAEHPATHPAEFSHAALDALRRANHPDTSVYHLPLIARHRAEPWPQASVEQAERLQARLARQAPLAQLSINADYPALYRVTRSLDHWPDVTLVIPTRDALALLKRCVDTIAELTDYPGCVTLLVVNNHSQTPETIDYLAQLQKRPPQPMGRGKEQEVAGKGQLHFDVLDYPHPFNYASINNAAVEHAQSELVGLVNNDIEALDAGWLCTMAAQLMRSGIGAVGAKLLWPNGMVQHGGVIGGQYGGLAGHVGNTWHDDDAGYLGMNQFTQRFSMVTAACLLLRKTDYQAVGGLNAREFPVGFNDVDLCLKLRRRGLNVVWTPNARLIHAESATRGTDEAPEKAARAQREMRALRERWGTALLNDPAYHPGLALDVYTAPFTGLALPPRSRRARSNQLPL